MNKQFKKVLGMGLLAALIGGATGNFAAACAGLFGASRKKDIGSRNTIRYTQKQVIFNSFAII